MAQAGFIEANAQEITDRILKNTEYISSGKKNLERGKIERKQ